MKQISENIWYIDSTDVWENSHNEYPDPAIEGGVGYYFEDETEQLNGPYETAEEAEDALDDYAESL